MSVINTRKQDYMNSILKIEHEINLFKKHVEFNELKIKRYYKRIDKKLKIKDHDNFDHNKSLVNQLYKDYNKIIIDRIFEKIRKKIEYNNEVLQLIDYYNNIIEDYKKTIDSI